MTQEEKLKKQEECYEILHDIFSEYGENNNQLESLHEMFIAFVADYRRNYHFHEQTVCTYLQLRSLLIKTDKIFKT